MIFFHRVNDTYVEELFNDTYVEDLKKLKFFFDGIIFFFDRIIFFFKLGIFDLFGNFYFFPFTLLVIFGRNN